MMAPGKAKFLAAFFLSLFAFMATTNAIDFAELGKLFKTNQANSCIQTSSSPMHWIALSWLTLMMGVFFMSAAMILSGAFSIQKYSDYIKGGLWGIFETAGLLSIFTLAFAGLWEYGIRNIDTARAYSSVIRNTLSFDFGMVIVGTTIFSFMSRQSPQIRIPGFQAFGLSFQLSPMFRPIFDGLGMMVQLLAGAVAAWTANEFLLCFIKTDMLILLMPLGFFLRAFGIKAGGNALLGMALSLFFIYPFMIIAVGQMVSDYYVNEMLAASTPHIWPACLSGKPICCAPTDAVPSSWDEPFLPNGNNWRSDLSHRISQERVILGNVILSLHGVFQGGSICVFNTGLARTYGTFLSVVQSWGLPTFAGLAGGVAGLNFLFAKYVGLSWITVVLLPVMAVFMFSSMYEIVFFVFVVSILLPILILFVCLTAAKEITKALGTEIDLSALEKLI